MNRRKALLCLAMAQLLCLGLAVGAGRGDPDRTIGTSILGALEFRIEDPFVRRLPTGISGCACGIGYRIIVCYNLFSQYPLTVLRLDRAQSSRSCFVKTWRLPPTPRPTRPNGFRARFDQAGHRPAHSQRLDHAGQPCAGTRLRARAVAGTLQHAKNAQSWAWTAICNPSSAAWAAACPLIRGDILDVLGFYPEGALRGRDAPPPVQELEQPWRRAERPRSR